MNEVSSVVFYVLIIFLGSIFAFLSQINFRSNNNYKSRVSIYLKKYFIFLSFLCLTIPVAIRHYTGADYDSYINMYNNISYFGPLSMFPKYEIGYVLLNYICFKVFNDYHSVFIIVAIVTNIFVYKAILYEKKNINLAISIFTYGFTLYFLEFVMIRNILAISIVFYGYKFLIENKKKIFFIIILFASMFHYSILFYCIVAILVSDKFKRIRIQIVVCLGLIIIILPKIIDNILMFISIIIPRLEFYSIDISNNDFKISLYMFAYTLPLLLFLLYYSKFIKNNYRNSFYFFLYISSVILLFISSFNPIITRFTYSLWPSLIILSGSFVKQFSKNNALKILMVSLIIIYGTVLIIKFITIKSYLLIPYKSMLC